MDTERVLAVRWTMTLDDLVDGNWFVQRPLRLLVTAIGVAAIAAGAVLTVASPGLGRRPSLTGSSTSLSGGSGRSKG